MAAPNEVTIDDMSGQFIMNRNLSDTMEMSHKLQGLNDKAGQIMDRNPPIMNISQYEDEFGIVNIDIAFQSAAIKGRGDNHQVLDWESEQVEGGPFGSIIRRSRLFKDYEPAMEGQSEENCKFLAGKTLVDGRDSAWMEDPSGQHIQIHIKSLGNGWETEQVWGFEKIGNKRYHTRRVVTTKAGKSGRMRLVFNYLGPVE